MPVLTATASFNAYDPVCTVNPCLRQVAGLVDDNPLIQYSACVSLFGSPVVTTVTPSAEVVFTTETSTVSYTDIIVSLTTQDATVSETVTVPSPVVETVTSFTTTHVDTVTTTVIVGGQTARKHKRGRCVPGPRTTSSSSSSSSSTSSASSAPFPTASECPSLEAYSSACACISAVATTLTVTAAVPTSTSTIGATVSEGIPSTSVSTVTLVKTDTATVTVPSTVITTLLAGTSTTSTVTVTSSYVAPTQTGRVLLGGNDAIQNKYLQLSVLGPFSFLTYAGSGVDSVPAAFIITANGQPVLANTPQAKLWVMNMNAASKNAMTAFFENARDGGGTAVNCSLAANNQVTCQEVTGRLTALYTCGSYLQLGVPGMNPATGCLPTTWSFLSRAESLGKLGGGTEEALSGVRLLVLVHNLTT
ncbi:hypothetical protein NEMBOFW57_001946 [Staphylotrichum longicolle]|uniref:Uncharacterized protein n=1 Tax=Staphylotrichum longicolle TaxID=669026 RepID=A0AAD4F3B3_9PEZI|nr:hypothetical protein NEMBOFW57_001946 [Staphylotrichum longicolle]